MTFPNVLYDFPELPYDLPELPYDLPELPYDLTELPYDLTERPKTVLEQSEMSSGVWLRSINPANPEFLVYATFNSIKNRSF
jgi:hypothetical protein